MNKTPHISSKTKMRKKNLIKYYKISTLKTKK